MPRDLFGDVTRPSISIGNRKWYTVPVSLLSHSVLIAMFVVLPILAAPYMPGVSGKISDYIPIIDPPKIPPARPPKHPDLEPPPNPNAAPLVTPTDITPEKPLDLDWQNRPTSGLDGTVPGGIDDGLPPPPIVVLPPEPVKPVRAGTFGVRIPIKTVHVNPVYPVIAQSARIQGIVIVEATISPEGRIINARILRSVPLLDQAALDAVRQWEFTPSQLNGVPVPVIMTVTVQFTLK
jgi:periplasmic protein TonB